MTRPFDAFAIASADRLKDDIGQWRIAGLIYELKRLLGVSPAFATEGPSSRFEDFSRYITELERRGIDVTALIRNGLRVDIIAGLTFATVIPHLREDNGATPFNADELAAMGAPAGWRDLMPTQAQGASVQERLTDPAVIEFIGRIAGWVSAAPLDQIVAWEAPDRVAFAKLSADDTGLAGPHRWIVERFTITYLDDWTTDSLRHEWRYQHGTIVAPCLPREMGSRRIDESDLAKALADRAARSAPESSAIQYVSSAAYVPVAVRMLEEGRRDAAAALFEGMAAVAPHDAGAINNYGFCLMPDRLEEALGLLDRAAKLGFEHLRLSVANRLRCLLDLGRITSALELAEQVVGDWDSYEGDGAYLWSLHAPVKDAQLEYIADCRLYLLDLIDMISAQTGDSVLISRWRTAIARLRTTLD